MRNSRQRCSTGVGMGGKASESMRLKFRFVFCEHTRDAGDSGDLAQFGEEILDSFGIAQQHAIADLLDERMREGMNAGVKRQFAQVADTTEASVSDAPPGRRLRL